jgi:hypothetical protein
MSRAKTRLFTPRLCQYDTDAVEEFAVNNMHNASAVLSVRKRGRPATETPAQRVERLERELQSARAAAKESERELDAIVGRAVRAEAEDDGEWKAKLADILRRRISAVGEKAQIAGLLV